MKMMRRCLAMACMTAVLALLLGVPTFGQEGRGGRGGRGAQQTFPEAPPIGFFGSYRVAADKMDPSKLPFIGAWRMNFDRSDPSMRAAGRFKPTATTIITAVNGGLEHGVFNSYPSPVDNYKTVFTPEARSYWFKLDGKNIYENPQGPNGEGQTVAMWLIDRNTIFRERATKGVVDERVLYRISPDGKTFTWTAFNADGSSSHVVWDKIDLPRQAP